MVQGKGSSLSLAQSKHSINGPSSPLTAPRNSLQFLVHAMILHADLCLI